VRWPVPAHRRQRKLDALVTRLQVQYGSRALGRAAENTPRTLIPNIPTTFSELDAALRSPASSGGIGGLPCGRISEITGPATSGKVTLAAKVLSAAHREHGALVAWIDLSRTCDPDYMHRCGLDLDRLLVVRPESGSDALALTLHLVESNTLAALVFDSLADLQPEDEPVLAGTLERLATVVTNTSTAVLFLSEPEAEFRTLAHVATVRLAIRRERWLMQGKDVRGYEGHVQILKNKLGQAGTVVPLRITFNGTVRGSGL
jgi:recombination protein RecA